MKILNNTDQLLYMPGVTLQPSSGYTVPLDWCNSVVFTHSGLCELNFSNISNVIGKQFGNLYANTDTQGVIRITIGPDRGDMFIRDATSEESKCVHDYVESISKPTGVTFDDAMNDNTQFVNILGSEYKIIKSDMVQHPKLERASGYCDFNIHTIVVDEFKNPDQDATEDMEAYKNKVLRHELVHAFLRESGLSTNSWADNEEIVDWIAIQAPKIFKSFKEVGAL